MASPQMSRRCTFSDRFVGDDLGAAFGHGQIDEDAGASDGAALCGRLEDGDSAAADTPMLGRAGVSASRSGIHFRISSATVNFSAAKHHQERQQLR